MRTRSRAGRVALLVFVLVVPVTGCHTFQPSTPLTVHVRDAETQAPVPGATVRLWRFGPHAEERETGLTTGADGNATTRLAPPDEGGVMVEVTAPNHLTAQTTLPRDVVDALASAKAFHPYTGPPLVATVDVFSGPRPTVELVVPNGFRGLIKAEVRVQADRPWPAGQRTFSYTVPPDGVVRADGPAVFGLSAGPEIVAKFADGTPLATEAKPEDVAFRWLRRDGTTVFYAVGTLAEANAARAAMGVGGDSAYSSGGSDKPKGGGGGRRGGGGMGGRGGSGRGGGFGR
ncbi:MAG: hypothetical protein J0I06_06360 [Planctomycetes bacterium]|nr:hypothetical protein [Planctomycetota bacterium]